MRLGGTLADGRGGARSALPMISGITARKKPSSVGLDITSESIAATEVENGGSVGRTAIVPLQPGVVKEGDLVNAEVLSESLKDLGVDQVALLHHAGLERNDRGPAD